MADSKSRVKDLNAFLESCAHRPLTRSQRRRASSAVGAPIKLEYSPDPTVHTKVKREPISRAKPSPKRTSKPKPKTASRKRKSTAKVCAREPENWNVLYDNIREMRSKRDAPVDSMGAEVLANPDAPPAVQRFHTLVSLMLSSQTKDEMTSAATRRLQEHGLTPQAIVDTSEEEIGKLIYGVGFWRRKAMYLRHTSQTLLDKFGGDIPDTVEGLISLKGVGPKMAHLVMQIAWKKNSGIGVDVHVHRICNRLRWVKSKNPEDTRKQLESWLPRQYWGEINLLMVGFGQQICRPVGPHCGDCLNRSLCPVGRKWRPPKSPSKKKK